MADGDYNKAKEGLEYWKRQGIARQYPVKVYLVNCEMTTDPKENREWQQKAKLLKMGYTPAVANEVIEERKKWSPWAHRLRREKKDPKKVSQFYRRLWPSWFDGPKEPFEKRKARKGREKRVTKAKKEGVIDWDKEEEDVSVDELVEEFSEGDSIPIADPPPSLPKGKFPGQTKEEMLMTLKRLTEIKRKENERNRKRRSYGSMSPSERRELESEYLEGEGSLSDDEWLQNKPW